MIRRNLLLVAVGALVAGTLAGRAGATTYCVADPACQGTDVPDLSAALAAAASDPGTDAIHVGPGTFTSPPGGFGGSMDDAVEIAGAGQSSTVLTAPDAGRSPGTVLDLTGSGATGLLLRDLTIRIPHGSGGTGVFLRGGTASRVLVDAVDGTTSGDTGVRMSQASVLRDSVVQLPLTTGSVGVDVTDAAGPLVLSSRVTADRALQVLRGTAVASLVRATGRVAGLVVTDGRLTVDGAVVRTSASASGALGMQARASGADATLVARHVTLVGGNATQVGVAADADGGRTASVDLDSSVIAGVGTSVRRTAAPGGRADVAVRYTDLAAGTPQESGAGAIAPVGTIAADPLFADLAAGDLRPRAGSPLIDAGDPAGLDGTESAIDIDGAPRIQNGRRDMGAWEFTPPPPAPPAPKPVSVPSRRLGLAMTLSASRIRAACPAGAAATAGPRCTTIAVVAFRLTQRARIRMSVAKVGRRAALRSRNFLTRPGRIRLGVPVRLGFSRLRPGRYRVAVLVLAADGRFARRSFVVTVLPAAGP